MKIFLDSGAFSVWNRGEKINLDDYISFIKEYEKELDLIATLDVIPGRPNVKPQTGEADLAAQEGFRNYEKMLSAGISQEKLLHTFHQNDPEKYLKRLVEEGGYIGVSPANDKTTTQRKEWMNNICLPILLDSKGVPKIKFHGFAVTSPELIFKYPWTSVDSSSWRLRGGGYGLIDIPQDMKDLSIKENCYIRSIAIGKGVAKYTESSEMEPIAEVKETPRLSQFEVSFRDRTQLKQAKDLLNSYGFNINELVEDHHLRAAWNGIYLISIVKKFAPTCTLYLASNGIVPVRILRGYMRRNNISTEHLNILTSYAVVRSKSNRSKYLDTLIKMKHNEN